MDPWNRKSTQLLWNLRFKFLAIPWVLNVGQWWKPRSWRVAQTVRPKAWPPFGKCGGATHHSSRVSASSELHSQGLKYWRYLMCPVFGGKSTHTAKYSCLFFKENLNKTFWTGPFGSKTQDPVQKVLFKFLLDFSNRQEAQKRGLNFYWTSNRLSNVGLQAQDSVQYSIFQLSRIPPGWCQASRLRVFCLLCRAEEVTLPQVHTVVYHPRLHCLSKFCPGNHEFIKSWVTLKCKLLKFAMGFFFDELDWQQEETRNSFQNITHRLYNQKCRCRNFPAISKLTNNIQQHLI